MGEELPDTARLRRDYPFIVGIEKSSLTVLFLEGFQKYMCTKDSGRSVLRGVSALKVSETSQLVNYEV